ncbi:hypothetical protein TorRG33x02_351460 [Trema orientale]|uniref:Uncharacterized protein n=1 Tax=Trema orientale TaxID=63057 RepID=A0A2P5AFU0_TREOI|nr:hypothetical protein TorRG33x02_351460 [Trema orientale]
MEKKCDKPREAIQSTPAGRPRLKIDTEIREIENFDGEVEVNSACPEKVGSSSQLEEIFWENEMRLRTTRWKPPTSLLASSYQL